MKKCIFVLLAAVVFVVGCSKKAPDPFKSFRDQTSDQIFYSGEKALVKGHYEDAAKSFEALDAIYPFGPHAEQSQLNIIYTYYMSGDYASAITAADRFTRLYPRAKHVDYAYYMRGVVGFNMGLSWLQRKFHINRAMRDISTLQQSFSSFSILTHTFPHSNYAPDSYVRMAYIRNLLAERELSIADFYLKRGAYVAAANRASSVVQHFQGSPEVAKALATMVRSYRALGLVAMEKASLAILQKNYPNSLEYRSFN